MINMVLSLVLATTLLPQKVHLYSSGLDKGGFFKLPEFAPLAVDVADTPSLTLDLPGSADAISPWPFNFRLTKSTCSGMIATLNAWMQRMVWPRLYVYSTVTNVNDLTGFDFTYTSDLLPSVAYNKNAFCAGVDFGGLTYATNRDLSALSPRIHRLFQILYSQDLLGNSIVSDPGAVFNARLDELDYNVGQNIWLMPEWIGGNLVETSWNKEPVSALGGDDALLALGEVSCSSVQPNSETPIFSLGIADVISHLASDWIQDLAASSSADPNFVSLKKIVEPADGEGRAIYGSSRAAKLGFTDYGALFFGKSNAFLGDFLYSRRITPYPWGFLNSLLGLCQRSIASTNPQAKSTFHHGTWGDGDAHIDPDVGFTVTRTPYQSPRYKITQPTYSFQKSAVAKFKLEKGGYDKDGAIKPFNGADVIVNVADLVMDGDMSLTVNTNEGWVIRDFPVFGWVETDPNLEIQADARIYAKIPHHLGTIDGTYGKTMEKALADLEPMGKVKIVLDENGDGTKLLYKTYFSINRANGNEFYFNESNKVSEVQLGTFDVMGDSVVSNSDVTAKIVYSANALYSGGGEVDEWALHRGPTELEKDDGTLKWSYNGNDNGRTPVPYTSKYYYTPTEDYERYTMFPVPRNPSLYEHNFLNVDVYAFLAAAVSTNAMTKEIYMGGASAGSVMEAECSEVVFRTKKIGRASTHAGLNALLISAGNGLDVEHDAVLSQSTLYKNSLKKVMVNDDQENPLKVAFGEDKMSAAAELNENDMNVIVQKTREANAIVLSSRITPPQTVRTINVGYQQTGDGTFDVVFPEADQSTGFDDVSKTNSWVSISLTGVLTNATPNVAYRRSALSTVEVVPIQIFNWNFPALKDSGE